MLLVEDTQVEFSQTPTPRPSPHKFTMDACHEIARYYGVTWEEITGRSRKRHFTKPRCAIAVMLRGKGWSYPRIGALLHRDHTTVMHSISRAPFFLGSAASEQ